MVEFMRRKRSWSEIFLDLIGISENRGWTVWLIVATIIGLITNFVALISCMSEPTQSIYLFRVSSTDLIDAMANLTDISPKDLALKELPSYWYYGLSGFCLTYTDSPTVCKRSFPPTNLLNTESMLTTAVEISLPNPSDATIKNTLKPWTRALSSLPSSVPTSSSAAASNLKASAGLAVLSILLTFTLLILSVLSLSILRHKLRRWMLYILAFADALIFIGAGITALHAMTDGPRSLIAASGIDQGYEYSYVGPGLYAMFGGAVFKLISVELILFLTLLGLLLALFVLSILVSCCCVNTDKRREEVVYVEYPVHEAGK